MNELINTITQSLGISQDQAGSAVGGLLQMIKGESSETDFGELLGKLPGASDLLEKAGSAKGGGGLLKSAMGSIGSALGGKAGGALNLASVFKGANLDADKGGELLNMFVSFLKDKCGPDLLSKVLGNFPQLSKLLG